MYRFMVKAFGFSETSVIYDTAQRRVPGDGGLNTPNMPGETGVNHESLYNKMSE